LIHRLQTNVVQLRMMNWRDAFRDYDPLRKGYISQSQFRRVMDLRHLSLSDSELRLLFQHYVQPNEPAHINYVRFCGDLDSAYTDDSVVTDPLREVKSFQTQLAETVSGGSLHRHKVDVASDDVKKRASDLVAQLASLAHQRRLHILPQFSQFDRANHGTVTVNRFATVLKDVNVPVTDAEVQLLSTVYRRGGDRVDYLAFAADLAAASPSR